MRTRTPQRRTGEGRHLRVVPEVLEVRIPGRDYDLQLGGEPWRCRVARLDPPLFVLTPYPAASSERG